MCRLGFASLLLGIALTTLAAEPEESFYIRDAYPPTVQIAQFNLDGLARTKSYRLSLGIVPIHAADSAPFGAGFNSASRLSSVVEQQQEITRTTNINWTRFFDSNLTSSSPFLRIDSQGERLEVRPRRHSVSIEWRKAFP